MLSAYPALVLNADFTPVSTYPLSTWSFERALRKSLQGRVAVLETYDIVFRSQRLEVRPPSVVALTRYVRRPSRVPFTRMNLFLRDDFRCQYCGQEHAPKDLTFDHVVPRSQGGPTTWENIVAACVTCNTKKGSRNDMRPLVMPKKPSAYDLAARRPKIRQELHHSWRDYLYWSGVLEND